MKPKERAKEITYRYLEVGMMIRQAKECALICVDEIISQGGTKNVIQYKPNCFTNGLNYWQEVKQEIEKL